MLADSLSLLCKTGDGLAHAYVRLDIHEKELTDISILNCFIHLRYVDLSGNQFKDISPLNSLTHLLTLKADRNLLYSAKLDELPYLQIASFANNKIMDTEGINHPLLEHLNLSYNEIVEVSGFDPNKLGRLRALELRGNKLMTTVGLFNLPNLKELYMAANTIRTLEGLDRLEHLSKLHLRDNQIEKLDGFSENMKNLQYINLRGNNITDMKEIPKLKCLPLLRALLFMECPVSDEDDYRIEVLISLRRLERLDKDEYTDDERQEAEEIYEQRRQEKAMAIGTQEVIHTDDDD
ncbi:Leucine-rich repeat-containing protein 23 [Desmophyllum pertusum]|uniref:Leucine-rich repeat-containing protein 23 n=1 Tax=Desmophyllum pertusum TaxID=174260 RepID=A0A9W9ZE13_9CNID|nr:Leucine-rich repeat-containing protein 23 [Desmophyllum pertusum]